LKERLDETKHKKIYLLKLDEINTERFEYSLNEALNKKYNYIVGELNYGDSHSTDPMRTGLQRFKDEDFHIVSIVLEASRELRLHRCRNDPKRNPFDKIDEMFFNHDSGEVSELARLVQINRQVHSIDGLDHPIPGVGIVPHLYRGVTR
jgi:hypothetical protein